MIECLNKFIVGARNRKSSTVHHVQEIFYFMSLTTVGIFVKHDVFYSFVKHDVVYSFVKHDMVYSLSAGANCSLCSRTECGVSGLRPVRRRMI